MTSHSNSLSSAASSASFPVILVSPSKKATKHYQRLNSPVISTLQSDYVRLDNPRFISHRASNPSNNAVSEQIDENIT